MRAQPSSASAAGSPGPGDEKRRRMIAKQPDVRVPLPGMAKGLDPWTHTRDIEEIFTSEIQGALRIEKIFEHFGDPKNEYMDIPWFDPNGKPNITADPLNRPLQLSTVAEYEQRLFSSGLADDCSGCLVV